MSIFKLFGSKSKKNEEENAVQNTVQKTFEDRFSEIQADMVSICMEYVEDRAEKVYIYCSFEDNVISSDFFYKLNGKVVERHKLNDAIAEGEDFDVSSERQKGALEVINGDIKALIRLCKEHQREMPTQIKLIYDVTSNKLNADCSYDIIYSNHPEKMSDDIAEEWYEFEKSREERFVKENKEMSKVFEDEFMDLQSGLISLCMEVTEQKVSKVYAYGSNEKRSKMFNAFFDVNGEIKTLDQLGVPDKLAFQFLKIGTGDLRKVDAICEKYNMPIPTEMKMYYDVETGKYDAKYKYEEVCSAKTGKNAGEVFLEWLSEIRG